jgi:hypothetical protein
VVDVVANLEAMAKAHAEKLNWKVSIVDLMKLLGLDSSLAARKELATELGCPSEKMGDSAQMNMWLHKTVLQKLADNGNTCRLVISTAAITRKGTFTVPFLGAAGMDASIYSNFTGVLSDFVRGRARF